MHPSLLHLTREEVEDLVDRIVAAATQAQSREEDEKLAMIPMLLVLTLKTTKFRKMLRTTFILITENYQK